MRASDLPEALGTVLDGKYRLESVLGGGGMGIVVLAHHEQLGRRVALKFLLPGYAAREEAAVRFAREARAAARIQSEHVVRVLDVGETGNGVPYMVMEYLEGEDLAALMERVGPLPIHDAVDYLLQACEALAEAHAAGIVHRDLKPANLFLARRVDGSSIVKVCDFGIAKATLDVANLTQTRAFVGSPVYSAPEQLLSAGAVDVRADVWALGVILYEFLTGAMPFTAQTIPELASRLLGEPPPDVRLLRADVPAPLAATIHQCLEKDLERRIPNVGVFARQLEECGPATSRISVDRIERVLGMTSSRTSGALRIPAPSAAPTPLPGSTPSGAPSGATSQDALVVLRPSGATLPTAVLETGRAQAISVATPEQKKKGGLLGKALLLGVALAALVAGVFAVRQGARIGPESAASAPTLAAGAAATRDPGARELAHLPEPALEPSPLASASALPAAASAAAASPSSSAAPGLPPAPAKRARSRSSTALPQGAAERPPAEKSQTKPQSNPLEMPLK